MSTLVERNKLHHKNGIRLYGQSLWRFLKKPFWWIVVLVNNLIYFLEAICCLVDNIVVSTVSCCWDLSVRLHTKMKWIPFKRCDASRAWNLFLSCVTFSNRWCIFYVNVSLFSSILTFRVFLLPKCILNKKAEKYVWIADTSATPLIVYFAIHHHQNMQISFEFNMLESTIWIVSPIQIEHIF